MEEVVGIIFGILLVFVPFLFAPVFYMAYSERKEFREVAQEHLGPMEVTPRDEERQGAEQLKQRAQNLYFFLFAIDAGSPQAKAASKARDEHWRLHIYYAGLPEIPEQVAEAKEKARHAKEEVSRALGALRRLTNFMEIYGKQSSTEVRALPRVHREALGIILTDAEKLRDALPARPRDNVRNGQGDPIRDMPSWGNFQENGCYEPAIFTPWLEKVGELSHAAEKFQDGVEKLKEAKSEKLGKDISSLELTSTAIDFTSPMLLPATNSLLPEEEEVIRQVQERLSELPAIEGERAKRALSTIAEAQILNAEASKGTSTEDESDALTIDGRSPEELVRAVIEGNVELLREQVLHSGVADQLSPVDQLRVLDIYTKDKRGT